MNKTGHKLYIFVAIQGLFVLLVVISFFFRHHEYVFTTDMVYSEETDQEGAGRESAHFYLPAGSYTVTIYYSSDADISNTCDIYSEKLDARCLASSGVQLFRGLGKVDFDIWLYRNTDDLRLVSEYHGPGNLSIESFSVAENNAFRGMALFWILIASLFMDGIYLWIVRGRFQELSKQDRIVYAGLAITIFYAAYPLFGDYILSGGDLVYHLQRVEGIRDSILHGIFPVRISPEWQQGYGYASPVFYGETILYIAGLLRVIGFDVTASFRIFMFMISTATVLISYQSFRRILQDKYGALMASFLYSTSIYRVYKVYCCESWGEMLGIMLLPWIVYGFYAIYTEDPATANYRKRFLTLSVGLALLIQSHLLTGEMVGGFTVLTCVWFWRKTFEPRRFLELAKSAVAAVLLSAWFLVPFMDYMLTGNFVIQNVSARTIQYRGLLPAHLLITFLRNGDHVFIDETGMFDTAAMGIGSVLLLVLCWFLYMCFFGKKEGLSETEWTASKLMAAYAVMTMGMSLAVFPWDAIQNSSALAATLVSSIQFPNRFLTIANVMLCGLAGMIWKHVSAEENRKKATVYVLLVAVLAVAGNLYLLEDEMERGAAIRVHNDEGMGTGYISGAEYLPYGADPSEFMPHDPIASGEVFLDRYEKRTLGASVSVQNPGTEEIRLAFPLLYYKGYEAENTDTGEKLSVQSGDDFTVNVILPPHFAGNVEVGFKEPFYWRIAEAVTLLAAAGMIWIGFRREVSDEKRKTMVSGK